MGQGQSQTQEVDLEKDLKTIEEVIAQCNENVTDENKEKLKDFKMSNADFIRIKKNVDEAKRILGTSTAKPKQDDFIKALAANRRCLHQMSKKRKGLCKMRDEARAKAKEARTNNDNETAKRHLATFSDYKKRITMVDNSMANIRDAIKMLTSNELNAKSMAALENIESVMGEIVKQIDAMDPEGLNDKFDDLENFINDIDGITASHNEMMDDDMDSLLAMIDNELAQDAGATSVLPAVPSTIPETPATKESTATPQRVAEME